MGNAHVAWQSRSDQKGGLESCSASRETHRLMRPSHTASYHLVCIAVVARYQAMQWGNRQEAQTVGQDQQNKSKQMFIWHNYLLLHWSHRNSGALPYNGRNPLQARSILPPMWGRASPSKQASKDVIDVREAGTVYNVIVLKWLANR